MQMQQAVFIAAMGCGVHARPALVEVLVEDMRQIVGGQAGSSFRTVWCSDKMLLHGVRHGIAAAGRGGHRWSISARAARTRFTAPSSALSAPLSAPSARSFGGVAGADAGAAWELRKASALGTHNAVQPVEMPMPLDG